MSSDRAYLDWNATAPLRPEARAAMNEAMDIIGNPSSVHAEGRRARAIVEAARGDVARLLGAQPSEVVFTSGGTEANNAVLQGGWDTILVCATEHDSVLAPARSSGARLAVLPVDRQGVVSLEALDEQLAAVGDGASCLLSLQFANNETGVLQPVAEAAKRARDAHVRMHSDAVQGAGRVEIDFAAVGLDVMSISAHKLGGPKGIGALVVRDGVDLPALLVGGGQEMRRRAGTENIVAIAGFGAAARAARAELADMRRVARLRAAIEDVIVATVEGSAIVGHPAARLPNTICFTWPGKSAETLLIRMDLGGVAISSGAACSSGKVGPSHVLAAMGFPSEVAKSALRVSIGATTSQHDIEKLYVVLAAIAGKTPGERIAFRNMPSGVQSRLETIMGEA